MKKAIFFLLASACAALALWAAQPVPGLLLDPPPQPAGSVISLSPQWSSYVWIGAAVAFGLALFIALTVRQTGVHPAVHAAVATVAYVLTVLVLTMTAGVGFEDMVGLGPALVGYMLIRFHGVMAFLIALVAAALARRHHSPARPPSRWPNERPSPRYESGS